MKLPLRPVRIPNWVQGIIEGIDASIAPLGSLASGLNLFATPADRLAVRGGSAVVNTLHDGADAELADVLRIEPFSPVAALAFGWSESLSKHYAYRLTAEMAFFTGTEATSRTDLTASPSTSWDVGPARPFGVELFSKFFLVDGTAAFGSRNTMVVLDGSGVLTEPAYSLGDSAHATGTLTASGQPVANDTVTLGTVTYTFKASVGATANDILLGADATDALTNLAAAVNADGEPGVQYGTATVQNPQVEAGDVDTSGLPTVTLGFTARFGGTGGNSIATTEASSHLSFGSGTLTGGAGTNPAPLVPLCAAEYNNVLFVAGYGDESNQDAPQRVRHSFLGQDPSDPVNGFDGLAYNDIGATGIPVKAMVKGRGILLVVKDNEMWRITGFGNAQPGWQYQVEMVNNTFGYGVSNPWALCFAEDYWYGWGNNGPFRTDGYVVESLRGPREFSWRLLNSFDTYFVEYHADRRVVCFGVHPAQAEGDRSATVPWVLWVWDVARRVWQPDQKFGDASHSPDFGAGFDLNHIKSINATTVAGPTGAPTILPVTDVLLDGFTANWTNFDTSASTEVWVAQAGGSFTLYNTAAPGASSLVVGGWAQGNAYSVQVRHTKAGVVSAFSAVTGWVPATFPDPNPPTAISLVGVVFINATTERNPSPPPDSLVTANATTSWTAPQAVDSIVLYMDGGIQHTWAPVTGGTVVSDYVFNPNIGGAPQDHLLHYLVTRVNYTLIQTDDITVTA